VDVRLLGPLEVRLGDGPIALGPRKQRVVLAMLALEAGRTVSADRLAEGLWGEAPPASAAKMIQLYVSHLRRVLDGDGVRIVTRGRGHELQLAADGVDVVRAERLLEASQPREALALWRGEPLADLADEPFAAREIRRLEELRLRAAELAADDYRGTILSRDSQAQMGGYAWQADYMSASSFLGPTFVCTARGDPTEENARRRASQGWAGRTPRRRGRPWTAASSTAPWRSPSPTAGKRSSSRSGSAA